MPMPSRTSSRVTPLFFHLKIATNGMALRSTVMANSPLGNKNLCPLHVISLIILRYYSVPSKVTVNFFSVISVSAAYTLFRHIAFTFKLDSQT